MARVKRPPSYQAKKLLKRKNNHLESNEKMMEKILHALLYGEKTSETENTTQKDNKKRFIHFAGRSPPRRKKVIMEFIRDNFELTDPRLRFQGLVESGPNIAALMSALQFQSGFPAVEEENNSQEQNQ